MAYRNLVGFELNDASLSAELGGVNGTASIQTTVKHGGARALRCNPTTTATGYADIPLSFDAQGRGIATVTDCYYGFAFRYATKPASGSEEIGRFHTGGKQLRINSSGVLELWDNTPTLHATGSAVLAVDTWYWITVRIHEAGDTQTIRVNGVTDISGTLLNTGPSSSFQLGKVANRNSQTVDFFFDDAVVDDAGYPPEGIVLLSVPIGAGEAAGWTNGTGSTFAEVDDVPNDGDTTYIQASATQDNLNSTFDMQTSSTIGISTTIRAVKSTIFARSGSISGTSAARLRTLSGGVARELTAFEWGVSYVALAAVDSTDPNGGGAWTTTKFDALEVGAAADAIAQVQRFTAAYLLAFCDVPVSAPSGTGAGTFGALTGAATGVMQPSGVGAGTFASLTGAATGAQSQNGTGAGSFASLVGSATGTQGAAGPSIPVVFHHRQRNQ